MRKSLRAGSLFWAITLLCAVVFLMPPAEAASGCRVGDGLIKLANSRCEIAFSQENGGIAYIVDKSTGERISEGTKDGILWWAALADGNWLGSINYGRDFSYRWHALRRVLTLHYPASSKNRLAVTVTVSLAPTQAVVMRAHVVNNGGSAVRMFGFPSELKVIEDEIIDALLPMIPGAKLRSEFFFNHQSYDAQYPGVMCADYSAVRSTRGKIAVYGRRGAIVHPVYLGFGHEDALQDYTKMIHNYKTWLEGGGEWTSPEVVIRVGQDYPETIDCYRRENGIDDFPSLAAKLGAEKERYFAAPMYKLDCERLNMPFERIKTEVIEKIPVPGLLHPVAFQPAGFDRHYPDFIPPRAEWGGTEGFADLVAYARQRGHLVMPYTNFSWWNPDSPTLRNLPAGIELAEIAVNLRSGGPVTESYNESSGYVMNLHHEFVADRIAAEHEKLLALAGVDAIFEDQFGARTAPYDYGAAGLAAYGAAASYFEGVLAHARRMAGSRLMTECGIDVLAKYEIGFMGTNYLWDLAGYRAATAPYTDYYPLAGMLFRDKVLLYQHNLAGETWTDDKAMFRWNLAFGYNFSTGLAWMEHPWLPLVGIFQEQVLSRYADRLVTGFEALPGGATRTSFGPYRVHANWDDRNSFACGTHIVVPGGAMVRADDGSVTGGVFSCYNGSVLSDGDHYLIEIRDKDRIRVYQPLGNDTALCIEKRTGWRGVAVTAHAYDGRPLGEVPATISGSRVTFHYAGTLQGEKVCYYELTPSRKPNPPTVSAPAAPDLVVTDLSWWPAKPSAGERVTFSATIKNLGTAATPAGTPFRVGFSLDDGPVAFWSDAYTDPIPPGASVTIEAAGGVDGRDWRAVPGDHTLHAQADETGSLAESDEGNNRSSRMLPTIEAPVTTGGSPRPAGPRNLALNKPVAASSHTDIYVAANAVDGFTSSYWESTNNVFPSFLAVDLGEVASVNKIVLKLPPGWEPRTQTLAILGGTDGKTYVTIVPSARYDFDPARNNVVTITFGAARVRYLRIEFAANTGWPAGQAAELEVYESQS